jgi:signal transduction histidine kinase
MKPALRARLVALELAILAVVVLLCWVGWEVVSVGFHREKAAARRIGQLQKEFQTSEVRYLLSANQVETGVKALDQALLRFAVQGDPAAWAQFERESQKFSDWIATERATAPAGKTIDIAPPLTFSFDLVSLLDEIEESYGRYLESAREVKAAVEKSPATLEPRLNALDTANVESRRLLALAGRARAFGESVKLFHVAPPKFPWETTWMPAVLLLLVAVCGWLAVRVYRREVLETIAMHQQLSESQRRAEQHEKLAQKGRTAAELAHELRNPLTAINFRLYTLQKSLANQSEEHQDAVVIRKEIRRLNAILEDFLQLDQSPKPNFAHVSAAELLREVRDLMWPQLEAQSIEVKLDADAQAELDADAQMLQQVLINLIKNAAESIGGPGTITLRARSTTAELRRQQTNAVVLEVEDTGAGIPAEVRERLYDPFFTTKKDGSGLGLSIVERIVEKHRGVLDFDTKLGEGTTFRITLPVEQKR